MIEDDGVGFDPADAERPGRRRGLGLLGIRERVAQLCGEVRIHSAWAGGTRIEIGVPRIDRPLVDEVSDDSAPAPDATPVEADGG